MPSRSDGTAATAASVLISVTAAIIKQAGSFFFLCFFTGSLLQLLPVFVAVKPLSSLPPLSTQKRADWLHRTETGLREEFFKMDVCVCVISDSEQDSL